MKKPTRRSVLRGAAGAFAVGISGTADRVVGNEEATLDGLTANKAVTIVATWHLADQWSYPCRQFVKKNPHAKRRPRPLVFDEQQQRKTAWYAVVQIFAEMPVRA